MTTTQTKERPSCDTCYFRGDKAKDPLDGTEIIWCRARGCVVTPRPCWRYAREARP